MNKLIYTSYSSNTRWKDLLLNVLLLFTPWSWQKGKYPKKIVDWFENKFHGSKAFSFNYARSGMYVLFQALKQYFQLNDNDEVIVQGFTCVAAVNPVLWAGLKVKYADIDPRTLNLSIESVKKNITSQTKVIMFQHTLGNSNGIPKIKQFCEKNDLILIEDCTNTILGKHHDRLIGTFGEASIFSLGRDKAVSGVDGGVILINNYHLNPIMKEMSSKLRLPSLNWTLRELLFPIFWLPIKTFYLVKIGKLFHLLFTKLGLLTKATSAKEKSGKLTKQIPSQLPNCLAYLAYKQLEDIQMINKHRIEIISVYRELLQNNRKQTEENGHQHTEYNVDNQKDKTDKKTVIKPINLKYIQFINGNIPLRYPLLVQNNQKENLMKFLKQQNVLVGNWYSTPIAPASVRASKIGYKTNICPTSEKICMQIINLPTHINVTKVDAKKVCNLINGMFKETT